MDKINFGKYKTVLLDKLSKGKNCIQNAINQMDHLTLLKQYLHESKNFDLKQNLILLNLFESNQSATSEKTNNFEFKFFKLSKLILILIVNKQNNRVFEYDLRRILNLVMFFCLNKSIKQYSIFKLSYDVRLNDDDNLNDELNLIEL